MEKPEAILPDQLIAETVLAVPEESFTVADFVRLFRRLHPQVWERLLVRFGQKGENVRPAYMAATYVSNRLWALARTPGSPLLPLMRWQKASPAPPDSPLDDQGLGIERVVRVFRKVPARSAVTAQASPANLPVESPP